MNKAEKLHTLMTTPNGIQSLRVAAKKALPGFPASGCATFQSVGLMAAGYGLSAVITWAETLADHLQETGWKVVSKRDGRAGDIGVSIDGNGNGAADHIWYVVSRNGDEMVVTDNQDTKPHRRSVSGKDGKTPTDFFLRPPDAQDGWQVGVTVLLAGQKLDPRHWRIIDGSTFVRATELGPVGVAAGWSAPERTVRIERVKA